MKHNEKPCRGGAGRVHDMSLLGGFDDQHDSPKTLRYKAAVISRRARVSPTLARTIARLAFEDQRAWR